MSRFLGIDYGERRIGLAVSDDSCVLATALGTHRTPDDGPFFPYLERLITTYAVTALVLGLPLGEAGEESRMATRVRRFADKLRARVGLPVILLDERHSSREAQRTLRNAGRRRPGGLVDALAAEIILQQYLDAHRAPLPEGGEGPERAPKPAPSDPATDPGESTP